MIAPLLTTERRSEAAVTRAARFAGGRTPGFLVALVGGGAIGALVASSVLGILTAIAGTGLVIAAVEDVPSGHPHHRTERLLRATAGGVAVPLAVQGVVALLDGPTHGWGVLAAVATAWVVLAVLALRVRRTMAITIGTTPEASAALAVALRANGVEVLRELSLADDLPGVLPGILEASAAPVVVIDPVAVDDGLEAVLARNGGARLVCVVPGAEPARVGMAPLGGLAAVELNRDPFLPASRVAKRAVDLVVASLVLAVTAPLVAAAAIAIRLDSPGSWLFSQERVGAGGRRFRLYKLRTMRVGASATRHEEYLAASIAGTANTVGGLYKLLDDDRYTRVGRLLRRLSIDELPQLWNVLRGDMSIVGPRPPLPGEVLHYPAPVLDRLAIRPGLTGLWQVSGRSTVNFDRMVELDVAYWQRWSLFLDLRIIARTPRALLRGETA